MVAVVLVVIVNIIGELVVRQRAELPAPGGTQMREPAESKTQADESAAAPPTEPKEVENFATMMATYDEEAGAKAFRKCMACHTFKKGDRNRVGPNLWGVVGRDKGTAQGFRYSDAMKRKGGSWGYEELDQFLSNPRLYVRGTKMSVKGYPDAAFRATAIGFLRLLSDEPVALPQ